MNIKIAKGKIFVFSAPSGAGKTTLINSVRRAVPEIIYSVSATTRPPREGEISGRHYFFLTDEEFHSKLEQDEFAEWACVHGHYYGTPKSFINTTINSGMHIIMDIDVFGKTKFDMMYPQAIGILILPPSFEELERRLRARQTDDEATIQLRLADARTEIEFAEKRGKYEYTIINNDLEQAEQETVCLVRSLL
ncbi:MAG: guanylate kinase [Chitinispirillaceae bacterium]